MILYKARMGSCNSCFVCINSFRQTNIFATLNTVNSYPITMKLKILLFISFFTSVLTLLAKTENKQPDTYAYTRGVELTTRKSMPMLWTGSIENSRNTRIMATPMFILLYSDAVRGTRCRSTDCRSSGTKARKCSVFTFYNSLI